MHTHVNGNIEGRTTHHSSPIVKSCMLVFNSTIIFMLFRYIRCKYLGKHNHMPNEMYSYWGLFTNKRQFFSVFNLIFIVHFMILSCYQLLPRELNTDKENTDERVKSERRNRPAVNVPAGSQWETRLKAVLL